MVGCSFAGCDAVVIQVDPELYASLFEQENLSSVQSLYTDLLRAKAEREQGMEGVPASQLLADMDRVIREAENSV